MANGARTHGEAVTDRELEAWERLEGEVERAKTARDRAAAEREAAVERDAARGKLDSASDWDLEEITGSITRATLDGVKAGRELRSKRAPGDPPATPVPPSWHSTKRGKLGAILGLLTALGTIAELVRRLLE